MKIVLLITGLGIGGAERQVIDLADRFVSMQHDVMLIYLTSKAMFLPSNPKVRVESVDMRKTLVDFILAYLQVRRLILAFQPDIIHSHMFHSNLFARLLRLGMSMPRLVCTAHSTSEGGRLRMAAYRFTDFLADINTNVSEEAVNEFLRKGAVRRGRIIVVPNGIDTERFCFDPLIRDSIRRSECVSKGEKVILAVGRLMGEKDYPNLLSAYRALCDVEDNIQLWIAGAGDLLPDLHRLSVKLNISERVRFLGLRRDVPALMSAADVFVLSSTYEGFGLVVGEAMACGRIVVATDCGGVKEVLGDCGYLVPPRNAEYLARAIKKALHLPSDRLDIIGAAARERVERLYSLNATSRRWIELYQAPYTQKEHRRAER